MAFSIVCILAFTTFALSLVVTRVVRRYALSNGIVDRPNHRSSHCVPTPRGGGLAIVVAASVGLSLLFICGWIKLNLLAALLLGGGAIAAVGFWDDRYSVAPMRRLGIHFIVAVTAVAVLGGCPPIEWNGRTYNLGLIGDILAVLAVSWAINLFNFMDGIDGIAGSEAVLVPVFGYVIGYFLTRNAVVFSPALIVGAASLGFLFWNWPPAKIFMGDVGSGYLGYSIGVLALAAGREHGAMIVAWFILGSLFFVDATVTLISRIVHGHRVSEAHRSHLYQKLSRRWGHRRVTILAVLVNVFWLFPLAAISAFAPTVALLLAVFPLVASCVLLKAGQSEQ